MDADLDLLLTTVYVPADDLLPEDRGNARRRVTDAEVVTLCVGHEHDNGQCATTSSTAAIGKSFRP